MDSEHRLLRRPQAGTRACWCPHRQLRKASAAAHAQVSWQVVSCAPYIDGNIKMLLKPGGRCVFCWGPHLACVGMRCHVFALVGKCGEGCVCGGGGRSARALPVPTVL